MAGGLVGNAHHHLHRPQSTTELQFPVWPLTTSSALDGVPFPVRIHDHLHQWRQEHSSGRTITPTQICTDTRCCWHSVLNRKDPKMLQQIKDGYQEDPWGRGILDDQKKNLLDEKLSFSLKHGLLFIGNCMVIPQHGNLLFHLAHDSL